MGTNETTRATIVLQNRESLLYLKGDGQWTHAVEEATAFEHIADASAFARKAKLSILDIVMSFGDPRYDVRLRASA
jgi:hypothetical protein